MTGGWYGYNGQLDSFTAYDRVLATEEIEAQYYDGINNRTMLGTSEEYSATTTTTIAPSNETIRTIDLSGADLYNVNVQFGGAMVLFLGIALAFIPAIIIFGISKKK